MVRAPGTVLEPAPPRNEIRQTPVVFRCIEENRLHTQKRSSAERYSGRAYVNFGLPIRRSIRNLAFPSLLPGDGARTRSPRPCPVPLSCRSESVAGKTVRPPTRRAGTPGRGFLLSRECLQVGS